MNKLAVVFGKNALPGAVEKNGLRVSDTTWRRWVKNGWVEKRGFFMLTIAGYRAFHQ